MSRTSIRVRDYFRAVPICETRLVYAEIDVLLSRANSREKFCRSAKNNDGGCSVVLAIIRGFTVVLCRWLAVGAKERAGLRKG